MRLAPLANKRYLHHHERFRPSHGSLHLRPAHQPCEAWLSPRREEKRDSGVPVLTTVLLAVANDKIYVWTTKDSGKVKRIRNNATVQIAPSTGLGRQLDPIAAATARILSVSEQTEAQSVTDRQFGWMKKFFALIWRLQGREQVYIEITPTEE